MSPAARPPLSTTRCQRSRFYSTDTRRPVSEPRIRLTTASTCAQADERVDRRRQSLVEGRLLVASEATRDRRIVALGDVLFPQRRVTVDEPARAAPRTGGRRLEPISRRR